MPGVIEILALVGFVCIGFVADRVKDKISETVMENQVEMNLAAVK